jgi:hypothetical protein
MLNFRLGFLIIASISSAATRLLEPATASGFKSRPLSSRPPVLHSSAAIIIKMIDLVLSFFNLAII